MLNPSHLRWLAVWLLRVALAFSFLSAVADRFGLWGGLIPKSGDRACVVG